MTEDLAELSTAYPIICSSTSADSLNVKVEPDFLPFRPVAVSRRKSYNLSGWSNPLFSPRRRNQELTEWYIKARVGEIWTPWTDRSAERKISVFSISGLNAMTMLSWPSWGRIVRIFWGVMSGLENAWSAGARASMWVTAHERRHISTLAQRAHPKWRHQNRMDCHRGYGRWRTDEAAAATEA